MQNRVEKLRGETHEITSCLENGEMKQGEL